jgi:iron-sulfur cluster insertion protein
MDAKAIQQALLYRKNNPQWDDFSLRVYISGKGCDGFEYGVSFDPPQEKDLRCVCTDESGAQIEIIVDEDTYKFVRQATITWVDDERGRGFLVENPRHKTFRGKFFKRPGWEQRM